MVKFCPYRVDFHLQLWGDIGKTYWVLLWCSTIPSNCECRTIFGVVLIPNGFFASYHISLLDRNVVLMVRQSSFGYCGCLLNRNCYRFRPIGKIVCSGYIDITKIQTRPKFIIKRDKFHPIKFPYIPRKENITQVKPVKF